MSIVLRQGWRLVIAGVVAGVAAALVVSRLMAGVLYGVTPTDWLTFAGVVVVLVAVALTACYVPARRVLAIDPVIALRYE